jgi:hypothetical protein
LAGADLNLSKSGIVLLHNLCEAEENFTSDIMIIWIILLPITVVSGMIPIMPYEPDDYMPDQDDNDCDCHSHMEERAPLIRPQPIDIRKSYNERDIPSNRVDALPNISRPPRPRQHHETAQGDSDPHHAHRYWRDILNKENIDRMNNLDYETQEYGLPSIAPLKELAPPLNTKNDAFSYLQKPEVKSALKQVGFSDELLRSPQFKDTLANLNIADLKAKADQYCKQRGLNGLDSREEMVKGLEVGMSNTAEIGKVSNMGLNQTANIPSIASPSITQQPSQQSLYQQQSSINVNIPQYQQAQPMPVNSAVNFNLPRQTSSNAAIQPAGIPQQQPAPNTPAKIAATQPSKPKDKKPGFFKKIWDKISPKLRKPRAFPQEPQYRWYGGNKIRVEDDDYDEGYEGYGETRRQTFDDRSRNREYSRNVDPRRRNLAQGKPKGGVAGLLGKLTGGKKDKSSSKTSSVPPGSKAKKGVYLTSWVNWQSP